MVSHYINSLMIAMLIHTFTMKQSKGAVSCSSNSVVLSLGRTLESQRAACGRCWPDHLPLHWRRPRGRGGSCHAPLRGNLAWGGGGEGTPSRGQRALSQRMGHSSPVWRGAPAPALGVRGEEEQHGCGSEVYFTEGLAARRAQSHGSCGGRCPRGRGAEE